jgi:uncharacterized protein (UPF0332 family)
MSQISWCKNQKNGIKLIEPNDNLSEEYLRNAEESMKILKVIYSVQSNMWLATTKYYIEYFSVYAVLMKIGIKCELHNCTLSLVKLLEKKNIFKKGTYKTLDDDKELRIDNQYYLKDKKVFIDFEKLSGLIVDARKIITELTAGKIQEIRSIIKNY